MPVPFISQNIAVNINFVPTGILVGHHHECLSHTIKSIKMIIIIITSRHLGWLEPHIEASTRGFQKGFFRKVITTTISSIVSIICSITVLIDESIYVILDLSKDLRAQKENTITSDQPGPCHHH